MDRFLFAEAMDDPENMKILLDIILDEDIELQHLPQTEKEVRGSNLNRMARIDVWAMDVDDTVYDTEVQQREAANLPKRSRYYQGMIDSKLLEPGTADFDNLNKVYIIIIMPFDLFGKGLYKYTFRNTCEEVPGLELGDEATRIFLNTRGENPENVSEELVQLLQYLEHTNDSSLKISDERVKRLQQNVRSIQQNAEMGVKYMQLWEEKLLERMEAREEGRSEGREEGRSEGRREGRSEGRAETIIDILEILGEVPDSVKQAILEQKDVAVLKKWTKNAVEASSVEIFMEQM